MTVHGQSDLPVPAGLEQVRAQVGLVTDPEIPVVTLLDLGILRDVRYDTSTGHPQVVVTLTPTYSGCPATEAIAADVQHVLRRLGHHDARVDIALAPAWTTDWITAAGRDKLRAYGIAPPAHRGTGANCAQQAVIRFVPHASNASNPDALPACPRCASPDTEKLSQFGSTPCQAQYRCLSCREPFDYFKPY